MTTRSTLLLGCALLACHAGSSNPDKPLSDPLVTEVVEAAAPSATPVASAPKVSWAERRARVVSMPLATLLASEDHTASCSELSARLAARPAKGLVPAERTLGLVARLEGIVQSQGFEHFFTDESGDDAIATADALKTIDAVGARPIFANALAHFPSGTPAKDRKARQAQIAAMSQGARAFDVETLAFHDPAITAATCDQMLAYALVHVKGLKLEPSKAPQDAPADAR
ncbi:MAG TPA: DUF4375 domain-containing protein [Polyangiaceae bacterium]